jgi:hypothetical protein
MIGKRRKQRTVPVGAAAALRDHWIDREQDFDVSLASALYGRCVCHLVCQTLQRLTTELAAPLRYLIRGPVQFANTSEHAFRHTGCQTKGPRLHALHDDAHGPLFSLLASSTCPPSTRLPCEPRYPLLF